MKPFGDLGINSLSGSTNCFLRITQADFAFGEFPLLRSKLLLNLSASFCNERCG
jgi:hypothetical protein